MENNFSEGLNNIIYNTTSVVLKKIYEKRNFILLIIFLTFTPVFRSCTLTNVDSVSFGFPFYTLDIVWSGIFPSFSYLFWFGFIVNFSILAIGYLTIRKILDDSALRRFLMCFSIIPFYLLFTGFLWWLEKWSIGTTFEPVLQSINIVFRIPAMFLFRMAEAMMAVGRDNIINFFNFGTGVSPDGAMRAIVLLFSAGFGLIGALWPTKEEKDNIF